MSNKLTILHHAGNPNMCRIPELVIKTLPEWEGGGWYMSREQAEMIVYGVNLTAVTERILREERD